LNAELRGPLLYAVLLALLLLTRISRLQAFYRAVRAAR
jgi:hypothetical protein